MSKIQIGDIVRIISTSSYMGDRPGIGLVPGNTGTVEAFSSGIVHIRIKDFEQHGAWALFQHEVENLTEHPEDQADLADEEE